MLLVKHYTYDEAEPILKKFDWKLSFSEAVTHNMLLDLDLLFGSIEIIKSALLNFGQVNALIGRVNHTLGDRNIIDWFKITQPNFIYANIMLQGEKPWFDNEAIYIDITVVDGQFFCVFNKSIDEFLTITCDISDLSKAIEKALSIFHPLIFHPKVNKVVVHKYDYDMEDEVYLFGRYFEYYADKQSRYLTLFNMNFHIVTPEQALEFLKNEKSKFSIDELRTIEVKKLINERFNEWLDPEAVFKFHHRRGAKATLDW